MGKSLSEHLRERPVNRAAVNAHKKRMLARIASVKFVKRST